MKTTLTPLLKIKLTLFVLVFSGISASAAQDAICENLHQFSCAPGKYDDGTGVGTNPNMVASERRSIESKVPTLALEKFKAVMKNPENQYFRRLVLNASGLSMNAECENVVEVPSEPCVSLLAEASADLMTRVLTGEGNLANAGSITLQDRVYVTDSPVFKDVQREVVKAIKNDPVLKVAEVKVRDQVFPRVRELLAKKVAGMVSDESTRKKIIERIQGIRFQGASCNAGGGVLNSQESISDMLTPNAFYTSTSNTFTYCSGSLLSNQSEFRMVQTIAHEMSHAIDPCRISQGPVAAFKYKEGATQEEAEQSFPVGDVISCLRKPESIMAIREPRTPSVSYAGPAFGGGIGSPRQNREDNQMPYGAYGYAAYPAGAPPQAQKPGEAPGFDGFCQQDQINEAFCDYMAAEVMPDYMAVHHPKLTRTQLRNGYGNAWRGVCSQDESMMGTHPPIKRRNDYLLLMQPRIREQMGCGPTVANRVYCANGQNSAGPVGGGAGPGRPSSPLPTPPGVR